MASGNKRPMLTAERRAGLQRRGLRLAYATLGWNVVRLRPSEVLGLHWPDLHLDESTRVDTLRISAGEPIKAAGVKWSPHAMRHTYATTLLERGVAIHCVAECSAAPSHRRVELLARDPHQARGRRRDREPSWLTRAQRGSKPLCCQVAVSGASKQRRWRGRSVMDGSGGDCSEVPVFRVQPATLD